MLSVQKWAENKPYLLAFFAPQMAANARDIHQAFRHIKERRILNKQYPLPPLPAWFAMYRSHRKPLGFLRTFIADFSIFDKEAVDLGDAAIEGFRLLSKNDYDPSEFVPTIEDIKHLHPLMQSALSASFQEIEDDFSDIPLEPSVKDAALQLFSEMELESSFFMLVLTPCWLLYREHPTRLYRKARLGEPDALEKLLRLDPLMLHDPAIGRRIQVLRFTNKTAAYQNLLEAPLKPPKARISRKKMKYVTAGLISCLSSLIKKPLTEPEIRALFDAVAQDADGSPIDTDLPDSPEAFAKAINRDRAFWLQMFHPDKKM